MIRLFEIESVIPGSVVDLLFCWYHWLGKHSSNIWDLVPGCLMCTIWTERNRRFFEDEEKTVVQLLEYCQQTLFDWSRCWSYLDCSTLLDFFSSIRIDYGLPLSLLFPFFLWRIIVVCAVAMRNLWMYMIQLFEIEWVILGSVVDLLFCWYHWLGKHSSDIWDLVSSCLMCTIWTERNRRSFENEEKTVVQLLEYCQQTLFDWSRYWSYSDYSTPFGFLFVY